MRQSKTHGFTLIEVLISLFIFTIIALIMAHALNIIFASQSGTENRAARLTELQIASLMLGRDIEQTLDRSIINSKDTQENALLGSATNITLTHGGLANPTGEASRSTLQRSSYLFEKNNLLREVWPVLDQTQTTLAQRRKILTHIDDMHFDYLDEKNVFHNTWPPAEQSKSAALPSAVRVTMKIKEWGEFSQLYIIPAKTGTQPHA
jgi:general secretion pathway protein J